MNRLSDWFPVGGVHKQYIGSPPVGARVSSGGCPEALH